MNFEDHKILNNPCYFKTQRSHDMPFALTGGYSGWNKRLLNYTTYQFKLIFTKPELLFTAEVETVKKKYLMTFRL